jgi:hypothetical protein
MKTSISPHDAGIRLKAQAFPDIADIANSTNGTREFSGMREDFAEGARPIFGSHLICVLYS